jgi:hypothetical protein
MSQMGQKHALPRRSIAVRFALNKQTLTERVQCDAMCQNRTHAPQQKVWLLDDLVGAHEEHFGDSDPEGFRSPEVNNHIEARWALDGEVSGLGAA